MTCFNKRFDLRAAQAYASSEFHHTILISDLHNLANISEVRKNKRVDISQESDLDAYRDLETQKLWVETMMPDSAMVKFRLPYSKHTSIRYLEGELFHQPYSYRTSTEVRLHVTAPNATFSIDGKKHINYPTSVYNCSTHEDAMFHYNVNTRLNHLPAVQKIVDAKYELSLQAQAAAAQAVTMDTISIDGVPTASTTTNVSQSLPCHLQAIACKVVITHDQEIAQDILAEWCDQVRNKVKPMEPLDNCKHDVTNDYITTIMVGLDRTYGKLLALKHTAMFREMLPVVPPTARLCTPDIPVTDGN